MTIQSISFLSIGALAISSQLAVAAEAASGASDKWRVSAMLGVVSAPAYLGDDDSILNIIPDVQVAHGNRSFGSLLGGLGYNLLLTEKWRGGSIIKYDFGRAEDGDSPLRISADRSTELLGLGDIDASFEVGGYIEYQAMGLVSRLEVRHGLSGGHEGLLAEVEIKLNNQFQLFGKPAFYSIGPEFVYGNNDYNQTYFGINAVQGSRSGLTSYQTSAGMVSYGLHGSVVLPLNNHLTLIGFTGYNKLGDEVAGSSLVKQRGSDEQVVAGFLVSHKF